MYEDIIIALCALLAFVLALRGSRTKYEEGVPVVPALLPWLGNAVWYGTNPVKYLKQCQERYGHAFRLLLAGNRYLVVSDALGVHSLLRDKQKAFTTFPVHRLMTKTVGRVTQDFDVVQIMMERLFPIINKECSPEHLDRLAFSFNGELSRQFGAVDDQVRALPTSLVTPLSSFITKHLYCAASKTVFGPLFPFETFADFEYLEKNITSLLSLSHLLYTTRAWHDGQLHGASEMATAMMSAMKDTQLSKSDVDGTLLTFMWGLHSNTFRIAYWFLAFLLNDREIFDRVKEEIDTELRDHYGGDLNRAVSSPSSSLDKHFPLISSGIKETMRLVVLLNSLREADTDTEIRTSAGPLQIRKGDILMPNVNAVHMDDNTYEDAKTFRLDRFVGDEKSKQTHLGFGGGTHLCKGRFFAVHVIKMLTIHCVRLWDLQLTDASGKPIVGNLPPPDPRSSGFLMPSVEVYLHIRPRDAPSNNRTVLN
ncbi:hypothetical protein NLI96_g9675 [Meripilus lineatus]|uniref:Cytochrome P450 n=1 Tax=Meripilus lineatus TaxID=2056292 RepID=A0AAD5UWP2_9APHY|nr:hypothetical protein NLI96_g9675 [Physisporinus lineatus]